MLMFGMIGSKSHELVGNPCNISKACFQKERGRKESKHIWEVRGERWEVRGERWEVRKVVIPLCSVYQCRRFDSLHNQRMNLATSTSSQYLHYTIDEYSMFVRPPLLSPRSSHLSPLTFIPATFASSSAVSVCWFDQINQSPDSSTTKTTSPCSLNIYVKYNKLRSGG